MSTNKQHSLSGPDICEHGRIRSRCKDCGSPSICEQAFGGGEHGQLGLNDEDDRLVLTRVGPQRFGGPQVVTVAAGLSHSAAVTEGG